MNFGIEIVLTTFHLVPSSGKNVNVSSTLAYGQIPENIPTSLSCTLFLGLIIKW